MNLNPITEPIQVLMDKGVVPDGKL